MVSRRGLQNFCYAIGVCDLKEELKMFQKKGGLTRKGWGKIELGSCDP